MFSHRLLFFSREATSETYGPRVSFHHIFLCDLFSLAIIFRSIKPKIQKYLAAIYLFRDLFILSSTFYLTFFAYLRCRTRKGMTTPITRRVASISYLCARVVYVVWGGSPTGFDNLGLITEGNTYHRYTASSLPLWGNTDVVLADIKRNFWHRSRGGSSTSTKFLITNLISLQFTLFAICLSFSSPPLHKKFPFYSLSFLFDVFSSDLFLSVILLWSHHDSREHQVVWFLKYQQEWFY